MEVGEWEVNRASGCHLLLALCGLRGQWWLDGEQWATVQPRNLLHRPPFTLSLLGFENVNLRCLNVAC